MKRKKRLFAVMMAFMMVCGMQSFDPERIYAANTGETLDTGIGCEEAAITEKNEEKKDLSLSDEDDAELVEAVCGESIPVEGSCGADLSYKLDTTTHIMTISGTGAMTNYTSASESVFKKLSNYYTQVVIEDGVTSIGENAFNYCTKLRTVTLPNTIQRIGEQAFFNCTALEEITLPESLTTLSKKCFYSCQSLTSIVIPKNVKEIPQYAFWKCNNMTTVSIQANESGIVTSIRSDAFNACSALETVYLPEKVVIEKYAFDGCTSVQDVYYEGSKKVGDEKSGIYYANWHFTKVNLKNLTFEKNSEELYVGDSFQLKVIKTPSDATNTIIWESSNPSVASVDQSGNVTGVSKGKATITASAGNISAQCVITVKGLESLSFDKPLVKVLIDSTIQLNLQKTPSDAKGIITWNSADNTIAIVDENGIVTGKNKGKTTVTATGEGITATCEVVVIDGSELESLSFKKTQVSIGIGQKTTLPLVKTPEESAESIMWSSSNEKVAVVNENGEVSGVAAGTALITAQASLCEASCKVVVSGIMMDGESQTTLKTAFKSMKDASKSYTVELFSDIHEAALSIPTTAASVTIQGNGHKICITGNLSSKTKLILENVKLVANNKKGSQIAFTVSSSKDLVIGEEVSFESKKTTVKSGGTLELLGKLKADAVNVGSLILKDGSELIASRNTKMIINKSLQGEGGTIVLEDGFHNPITLKGNASGTVRFTGTKLPDGAQILTVNTKMISADMLQSVFDVSEITENTIETRLVCFSGGKVGIFGKAISYGDKEYFLWKDALNAMNADQKAGKTVLEVTFSGDVNTKGAFTMPKRGYSSLTIKGGENAITFTGNITLTGNTVIENLALHKVNNKGDAVSGKVVTGKYTYSGPTTF